MKKKFITNLALLIFLNLLIKPFWIFGIDLKVQNLVGAGDYGFYISLFNFSLLLNILLDLGITNHNNRNISRHKQLLSKYLSNIVVLKFFLAFVYLIISLIVAIIIGYSSSQMYLLMFLVFNQFLISFTLYLRSNISGLQLFRTDSLLSVLDKFLMIIICTLLLYGNITKSPFKIEWFVYAQTAAYLITALIIFLIVLGKSEFLKLRVDIKFFRLVLRQSLPYALLALLMAVYTWSGMVILERILDNGKEQAGIYAQGNRLLEALSMFGFLFAGLLYPMFSKMIKENESIKQLLSLSALLLIVPSIILAIGSLCYRNEIINYLYHEQHANSASIFAILMFSFVGIGVTYIFGSLLTANGSLKQLNSLAGIGVVINVTLNIILIPKYEALGMAFANLITQSYMAIAQLILAIIRFRLKINTSIIIRLLISVLSTLTITYFSCDLPFSWIMNLIIALSLSTLIAMILRLISLRHIYTIIKYNE